MANSIDVDRLPLSPRTLLDLDEWFGREANPEGTINVPLENPYAPYPEWTGIPDTYNTQDASRPRPTPGKESSR